MKKNRIAALSLALALSVDLCVPAYAAETTFSDVPADHWAAGAISRMAEDGVVSGVGNGQFAPDRTITYAEFIAMIARKFLPDQIGPESEPWYSCYMEAARSAIYMGDGSGILFDTKVSTDLSLAESSISRYDMAEICWHTMEVFPKYIDIPDSYDFRKEHPDVVEHVWAVSVCYNLGILTGVDEKGNFNGGGFMTRAQAAVVMERLINYKNDVYAYLETSVEIPNGALTITEMSQLTGTIGVEVCDGGFHLNPNLVLYGGSNIGFDTNGYSTVTFTFKAGDKDTLIRAGVHLLGNSIWDDVEMRGSEVVSAGETRTLTFDCRKSEGIGFSIDDNSNGASFAEGWITNIYLTK